MDPATISIIVGLAQLAIKEAPDAIEAAIKVKNYFASLVSAGVITAEVQNQLNAELNEWMRIGLSGVAPKNWKVVPDAVPQP